MSDRHDSDNNIYDLESILAEFGSGEYQVPAFTPKRTRHEPAEVISFPTEEVSSTQDFTSPTEQDYDPEDFPDDDGNFPDQDESEPEEESTSYPEQENDLPIEHSGSVSSSKDDPDDVWNHLAGASNDSSEDISPDPDNILEFPEEKTRLSAFLDRWKSRANNYADHMFEDAGKERSKKTQHLESMTTGVDEEEDLQPGAPKRRIKLEEPLPPDRPLKELVHEYHEGIKSIHTRSRFILLLALVLLALSLVCSFLPTLPLFVEMPAVPVLANAVLLLVCILLAIDCILNSIKQILSFRVGIGALITLACILTILDTLWLLRSPERAGTLPLCTVSAFSLYFLVHGEYMKRVAKRTSCKVASTSENPFIVTLDERKWNNKDTYCKFTSSTEGFGSQIEARDFSEKFYSKAVPVLLLLSIIAAVFASIGQKRPQDFIWALSSILTSVAGFSSTVVYTRTFARLARRLSTSGAAIAGWPSVQHAKKKTYVLIEDGDLFPPGYARFVGMKFFGEFTPEKVIGYTGSVMKATGSCLNKIFYEQMYSKAVLYRETSVLKFHEGGYTCNIHDDEVIVGTEKFMESMGIRLPKGVHLKPGVSGVLCAINGDIAGLFAVKYALPDNTGVALSALLAEKCQPVMATRDFNAVPSMLQDSFGLPAEKMHYPATDRRVELTDEHQLHDSILCAVLCREGIGPYSEVVIGSHRLRSAVKFGTFLSLLGSVIGLLLAFYLTSKGAYIAMSPINLLIFQLAWTVPTYLVSNWVTRF